MADVQVLADGSWPIQQEWDDSWLSDATLSPGVATFLDSLSGSLDGLETDGHLSDASSKSLHSSRSTPPLTAQPTSSPQCAPSTLPLQTLITSLLSQPKLPGMPTLLPAGPLKRSLDGSDSDATHDGDDCGKRLKPLSRSEKNRMAAANSRAKHKQSMHELTERVAQLQVPLTGVEHSFPVV